MKKRRWSAGWRYREQKSNPEKYRNSPANLLGDIRSLIQQARERVAVSVNSTTVLLYWQIGIRIRNDVLKNERAEYGKQIFYALSRKLTEEFGNGFSQANIFHMVKFAEMYPDRKNVQTLSAQLF